MIFEGVIIMMSILFDNLLKLAIYEVPGWVKPGSRLLFLDFFGFGLIFQTIWAFQTEIIKFFYIKGLKDWGSDLFAGSNKRCFDVGC